MDLMTFITEMYIPLVMTGCLCVGFILKKWIREDDDKWIPTILLILGAVLACIVNGSITTEMIIAGAASGLGSTGFHQMFNQHINSRDSN